ncbi:cytochrome P450 726A27-like [Prosopis cineraria]|uniref:cytochrome P450 726A27-like n=1 Tax=Prosopis cineraria TaxID=364024 RepID=UPI0024107B06|nr:cytochrome P450 726A27-like [Prosopis cineraria]
MHLQLGQTSLFIVSSPEVAKEVMKTQDVIFANRPTCFASETLAYNSTDIAFSPHGNYWRQLRKICTLELLSLKRVQTFRRIREEEVFAFVKHISEQSGSAVNLTRKIYPLTNSIVARAAFGRKTGNIEEIVPVIMSAVQITGGLSIADVCPSLEFLRVISGAKDEAEKARKGIDVMLNTIIKDHLEKDGDVGEVEEDLVDVLLRVQKENDLEIPLTMDNIKAVILDMFVGGTETAATTTIGWAMAEMIKKPTSHEEGTRRSEKGLWKQRICG